MPNGRYTLAVLAVCAWFVANVAHREAEGDLIVSVLGTPEKVDFTSFTGSGFSAAPVLGQLDSATWRVGGLSDGTLAFGGTGVTGDFARGKSSGGVTSGGVYAFEVASGDWALGVQPTGTDFNPGFFELRIRNRTGVTVSSWLVAYDVYCRNDQARASSWNYAYSTDGSTYTNVSSLDFTSPGPADSTSFLREYRTAALSAFVPDDGNLYFRWSSGDASGSTGSRDEFALDNVTVTATPEPGSLMLVGTVLLAGLAGRRRRSRSLWQFVSTINDPGMRP